MFRKTGYAALLLLFAMAFAACSGSKEHGSAGTTPSDNGEQSTNEQGEALELPDVQYNDIVRVYVKGGDYADEIYPDALDAASDDISNAVVKRNDTVGELFGVEFEYTQSLNAFNTDALTVLRAGEDVYDIMQCHGRSAYSYAGEGLVVDWNTLPYVSLEKSWWNVNARENLTVCGVLYAMTGELGYSTLGAGTGTIFNKTLFRNEGIDPQTVYDMVDNGEWTFDALYTLSQELTRDLNGDGSVEVGSDQIGYATTWWGGPIQILYSTGSTIISFSQEGVPEFGFYNAANIDLFDRYFRLIRSENGYCYNEDSNSNMRRAFSQGHISMMTTSMSALGTSFFIDSEVDFGVLPFPKYNEEVDRYYSVVDAASALYTVPNTTSAERREMIGVVLEALAYYGQKELMPVYYDRLLTSRYLRDEISSRMLDYVYEGCTYDLGYYNADEFGSSFASIGYELVKNENMSFTLYYSQNITAMQQRLEQAYSKYAAMAAEQSGEAADPGAE